MSGEFTIEYVELPNGRMPGREFVDSLDDKAAARIDAFIERLRVYGKASSLRSSRATYSSCGSSNSTGFSAYCSSINREC
jgi:hypothetical protein